MRILYVLLALATTGCTGQNDKKIKEDKPKQETKMNEQELEALKKQGYKAKEQDTFMIKNGKLDIKELEEKGKKNRASVPTDDGWKNVPSYNYDLTLKNGTHIYIRGNELSGYSKKITKKDAVFETVYVYFPSGNLKTTGMVHIKDFAKGTWFWYNERGQINRLEEYDKDYEFTWEDVLVFLKEKDIKHEDIEHIRREVKEEKREQKPYWYISIIIDRDGITSDITREYTLDGHTGKVLNEEILDLSTEY